jgi:anti-sigma regulatory factor (Ser/Thr protein kinase)
VETLQSVALPGWHAVEFRGTNEGLSGKVRRHLAEAQRAGGTATTPRGASRRFEAVPEGPRAARHFVADALASWGYTGELLDDAQLVISELATNAVIHARSPFWVETRAENGHVRVSVRDQHGEPPRCLTPDLPKLLSPDSTEPPRGHGLRMVAALARDWGVDSTADGKAVWAELRV